MLGVVTVRASGAGLGLVGVSLDFEEELGALEKKENKVPFPLGELFPFAGGDFFIWSELFVVCEHAARSNNMQAGLFETRGPGNHGRLAKKKKTNS